MPKGYKRYRLLMPDQFIKPAKAASAKTRQAYHNRCLLVPWAALRFQHTSAIRAQLSEQYKPATVNKMSSALRGTLKAVYDLGQLTSDDDAKAMARPHAA
jgi:hypothetical protein